MCNLANLSLYAKLSRLNCFLHSWVSQTSLLNLSLFNEDLTKVWQHQLSNFKVLSALLFVFVICTVSCCVMQRCVTHATCFQLGEKAVSAKDWSSKTDFNMCNNVLDHNVLCRVWWIPQLQSHSRDCVCLIYYFRCQSGKPWSKQGHN